MKRTPAEQARILSAHLRDPRAKNFLKAFLQDEVLQQRASAQRFLTALWSQFRNSIQGQLLLTVEEAHPRDAQDQKQLRAIRARLEQGERLLPRERDLLEELAAPKTKALSPEVVQAVQTVFSRLVPLGRSDRDVRALCGHLQQWLRKQGIR